MTQKNVTTALVYLALIPLSVLVLFPFFWLLSTSLKPEVQMFSIPPKWIPDPPTLKHYLDGMVEGDFWSYLRNSLLAAVGSTALGLVIGMPAAFGFARFRYRFSNVLFSLVIMVRMFPQVTLVIPFFLGGRTLGLIDTIPALIIAYIPLELPLIIWLLQGFFRELPEELLEAAELDGLGPLGILTRIVVPISLPAIGVATMFGFLVAWNEFIFALTLTRSSAAATMPVGIAGFVTNFQTFWGPMTASAAIYTVPVLLVTFLAQRGIVRGLLGGAMKG